MKGEQLPLSVQLRSADSFDTYFTGPNTAAVAAVREAAMQPVGGVLLFGPSGAGKTHLLHAASRLAQEQGRRIGYLPLRALEAEPGWLDELGDIDLLLIDDIDMVLADSAWALSLLRQLDRLRAAGHGWLLSAAAAPERLDCALPDLRTRLAASAVFGLRPLDDADRATLLREQARQRGLELPTEVSRWLLNHLPRNPASLLAALEKLDAASLRAQRRLTLPFVQLMLRE